MGFKDKTNSVLIIRVLILKMDLFYHLLSFVNCFLHEKGHDLDFAEKH